MSDESRIDWSRIAIREEHYTILQWIMTYAKHHKYRCGNCKHLRELTMEEMVKEAIHYMEKYGYTVVKVK